MPAGRCRILVIEDDHEMAGQIVEFLAANSYEVDLAVDGNQGLSRARSAHYAVMTIDRMLPGIDGISVIRRSREEGIVTPALIVSALGEIEDRVRGLRAGGDDYLVKPFALEELLARVASLLRRREQPNRSPTLTPREQEVFELLARGLQNAEIASRLVISPKTVGTHIAHIYEKLGARSRVEALNAGQRHELLPTAVPD
jgi:two-component system OmpR family response regulator